MFGFFTIIFISFSIIIIFVLHYKLVKIDEFILQSIMSLSVTFLSVFLGLYFHTQQSRSLEIDRTKQLISVAMIDLYSNTTKCKDIYIMQYSKFCARQMDLPKNENVRGLRHPFPTMVGNLLSSENCLKDMSPSSIYYLSMYYDEMKNEMQIILNQRRSLNDSIYISTLRNYYHFQLLLSSILHNEKKFLDGDIGKEMVGQENARVNTKITTFCMDNKFNRILDIDLKQTTINSIKGSLAVFK